MKIVKYLIAIMLIIILSLGGLYLFRNPILTSIAHKQLSIANGALVEIEGLNNRIFTMDIAIERMTVADREEEYKNFVELNGIDFSFEAGALLAGKLIINKMNVDRVELSTARESSGSLPEKWIKAIVEEEEVEEKEESKVVQEIKSFITDKVEGEKEKIAILNLEGSDNAEKVEEILTLLDIQLQQEYNRSIKELEERTAFWQDRIEDNQYKKELNSIEEQIKSLNYDFSTMKNIRDLEALKRERDLLEKRVEQVRDIVDDTKNIVRLVEEDKKLIESEIQNLDNIRKSFIDVANKDYDRVKAIVSLDADTLLELSYTLIGEDMTRYIAYGLGLYSKIIEGLSVLLNSEEGRPDLPVFWIKEMSFNLVDETGIYKGKLNHLTSNQTRAGQEFTMKFNRDENIELKFAYDNRERQRETRISFDLRDIVLDQDFIKSSSVSVGGSIYMARGLFQSSMAIVLDNMSIVSRKIFKKEAHARILDQVTSRLNRGEINIDIEFGQGRSSLSIDSNVDKELYKGMQSLLQNELDRLRREVESKAQAKLDSYIDRFTRNLEKRASELGISFRNEELEALKRVRSLEDLEKTAGQLLTSVEAEYRRLFIQRLNEERKRVVDRLRRELEVIGIDLRQEHYEAFNRATSIEELDHIAKEILEDLKVEAEERLRKEVEEEKRRLEERLKREAEERLRDRFRF